MLVLLRSGFSSARARSLFPAIALSLLACLLLSASALAETTREGTLRVVQADTPGAESIDPEYSLETESGTVDVVPTELEEGASSGDTAKVTGSFEEGELVGGVDVTAQANEEIAGSHKVLVLAVRFPGDPEVPFSLESIRKKIFTGTESVNSFYKEESYGQISFTGKLNPEGDVFGWFEVAPVEGCDHIAVRAEALDAAEEQGISWTGYDHVVVVQTDLPCWWNGMAAIGGSWISINGNRETRTYVHEFGHNLGFKHANGMDCLDSQGNFVTVSDNCHSVEYSDPYDNMGNIAIRHNAASRLQHLGIIDSKSATTIETDGTYEVESALDPTEGTTALRIPRFFDANRKLTGYYELEIRKQGGLFEDVEDSSMTGVSIRKVGLTGQEPTSIYDVEPQQSGLTLGVGKTFDDGSVSITTLSAGEGKATVEVNVPPESDIKAPTAPSGLTATPVAKGLEGVDLSWKASEDNVGVARYRVFRDGEEVGTSAGTEFTDYPRQSGLHAYVVYAEDEGGNWSPASAAATVDVELPFTIAPTKLDSFGSEGSGDGKFGWPSGAVVDPAGNVWIADSKLDRIQKFNEKGEFLLKFGGEGSGPGQFKDPLGMATTAAGELLVVDNANRRVQRFDSSGKYLGEFGSWGWEDGKFIDPMDIAVAPDGSIWVSDRARNDVQKFTAAGKFTLKSGKNGSGDGEFKQPYGIGTDGAGNLWVADQNNNRLQKLSPTGAFVSKIGSKGSGPGQFIAPREVVVKPDGSLLVADGYENHRVQHLTSAGQLLSQTSQWNPFAIALGRGGKFYVTESGTYTRVDIWSQPAAPEATTEAATSLKPTEATLNAKVNPSGENATYWFEYGKTTSYGSKAPATAKTTGWGAYPVAVSEALTGLSRETGYHYRVVAKNGDSTVYGKDQTFLTPAVTPTNIGSIGSKGTADGQFWAPYGVAVDPSGNVWVTEAASPANRVQKFNEKGEFLLKFGGEGNGPGKFLTPMGIAATAGGDVWVVDQNNQRIQKFNSKGEYVTQFGAKGTGNGQFLLPKSIAIAPDGSLWVSDAGRHDVQKFTSSGGFILKSGGEGSGNGQFLGPRGLATDAAGNVWVVDQGNNRIQELSPSGAFLTKFGSKGSAPGQFTEPYGVAVKPEGSLLVSDSTRIQQLTTEGQPLAEVSQAGAGEIALGRGGKFFVPEYSASSRVDVWSQPAKPEATTEAATGVEGTKATFKAAVNPGGSETVYWFEWGLTTAYGGKSATPFKSAGSGAYPVAVSEARTGLSLESLYHYRVVAESAEGIAYGKDMTFTTPDPSGLGLLPVVQPFDGSGSSAEKFAGNWSALGWATGETAKGQETASGWGPAAAYPTVNGAFYKPTLTDTGPGVGTAVTLGTAPTTNSNYFSLWLDASGEKSSRAGYELRFTRVNAWYYNVALKKWVAGAESLLASKSNVLFAGGDSLGLVDKGGTVKAWMKSGSNPFTELLSASDSALSSGNAAIEGAGNTTRLKNFKAGPLS